MLTVVHVHGTGVREPRYTADFHRFRDRLRAMRSDVEVVPCNWGAAHGSRLYADGVSIPDGRESARGGDEPTTEDREIALWGILEVDPLFELGVLASGAADDPDGERAPNQESPGEALTGVMRQVPDALAGDISALGLRSVFADAISEVLESDEARESLDRSGSVEVRAALARAVVAMVMHLATEDPDVADLDGAARDDLVAAIRVQLGDSERGMGADIGRFAGRLALRLGASKPFERRRAAITRASTAVTGDILLYLARGAKIREFIAKTITEVPGPVVVVAHSLGGVAAVDLLVHQDMAQVDCLVTVGSQAPLMYEIGALPSLDYGAQLPAHFPRWVNIFDHRDLLSFVGGSMFGDKCVDRAIDNRSPFPRSHSAYFANDRFYDALDLAIRDGS